MRGDRDGEHKAYQWRTLHRRYVDPEEVARTGIADELNISGVTENYERCKLSLLWWEKAWSVSLEPLCKTFLLTRRWTCANSAANNLSLNLAKRA